MIEGVCVCWERFKSGEIEFSELIDQLNEIESSHHDWPPALIVNLVQHLESAFDQGDTDQQKVIKILSQIPTQSEAKITSYTKCLRSLVDHKVNDEELIESLFNLVESLVDPGKNWTESEQPKNDSNCRLLGSVDSLIALSAELINQKYDYDDIYQMHGISMIGVLLSSNQHAHHLVLTEQIYQSLLGQLRSRFENAIIIKVIVRFIHQLHHTKGLPPFPLEVCIQPLVGIVTAEYELQHKLTIIDLLADCLNPSVIDLHMLQAKVLPAGLHLPKLVNQMIEARMSVGFCLLRFMRRLTFNNQVARETISEAWGGWTKLVDDLIKVVDDPMKLARDLLDFSVEPAAHLKPGQSKMSLKIGHIPASLISHFAEFDDDTQDYVLNSIVSLFQTSTANKVIAHGVGFVPTIVDILGSIKSKKLNIRDQLTLQLIRLLSLLCSFSITPDNLRSILNLMSHWPQFAPYILSALSEMPQTPSISQHSFALYEYGSGITCSETISPSSKGWTFFAWICVDTIPPGHCRRRLLLSLIDDDDWCGYEIFISQQNQLVLASLTQSHFSWVSEPVDALTDGQWHSIAVAWTQPKTGAMCQLYIDGQLVNEVNMNSLPSTGQLRVRLGHGLDVPRVAPSKELPSSKSLSNLAGAAFVAVSGLARRVKKSSSSSQISSKMNQITNFEQDQTFGRPGPLCGLLGYCTLVEGACQASHFEYLHKLGPNSLSQYQATCEVTVELQRVLRLYYHPKNISGHKVYNLAPGDYGDASLVGQTHGATDLRGAIHALSGVTVLYPLLEEMKSWKMSSEARSPRLGDSIINAEEYPVASFLQLIRRVLSGPEVALRALSIESNAFAVLGALLQRLPGRLIDGEVLYQIQLLSESFDDSELISSIRHFLLFDFRVWVDSAYITRVCHIQYLSTLIKDSRRTSRSKYGVQFMLDVIRTFCSTNQEITTPRGSFSSEKSIMLDDEEGQVREAIFQLIQFYMLKNATVEEIDAVLSFIISCGSSLNKSEQKAAVEALVKLNGLLRKTGSENLVRILFEAERGELLWVSMLKLAHCGAFQKETLALFLGLLKSPHVSDAYRGRIRLHHNNHSVMGGLFIKLRPCEPLVHKKLIELMFKCDFSLEDKFNLGQLLVNHHARAEERLQQSTALMDWLLKAPEAVRLASQIRGWQDTLVQSLAVDIEDTSSTELLDELSLKSLEVIFQLSWKGTGHIQKHKTRWIERLGVWTLLNDSLPLDQSIIQCQSLLDMWLQAALSSDRVHDTYTISRDGEILTHLFHHYFMVENRIDHLKDSTLESLMKLLDILMIWESSGLGGDGWPELQRLALSVLLQSLSSTCDSILALCTARLHQIISYRKSLPVIEEACFILDHFNQTLDNCENNPTACSFIFPVLRDILEQIPTSSRLAQMPRTKGNAKFQAEFTHYQKTEEWEAFIISMVKPSSKKFKTQIRDSNSTIDILAMLSEAKEAAKVAGHARDKKNGEAKLEFEELLETPYSAFLSSELNRYNKAKRQLTNQQSGSLRAWRRMRRFLLGARGPWSIQSETDSIMTSDDQANHWKLSNVENFSRMRLKLTQNYNFDIYREASELRDNRAPSKEIGFELPEIEVKPKLEDENEGDEDWNALVPDPTRNEKKEVQKVTQMCHLITLTEKFEGRLEISDKFLYFFDESPKKDEDESNADFKWSLTSLKKIFPRRYNLRRTAIEMFMFDQTNYLINFECRKHRDQILKLLQEVGGTNVDTKNAEKRFAASGITQKWLNHEITNFEYLMQLNTFAGRTYNDLSQYPVFPWVIADYTSTKLDLSSETTFRDLAWPVGALNPKNRDYLREKYEGFIDPSGQVKQFHYGTHYSNAPTVMHYLIRLEPFTALHIQLQGGKFDIPDRQFHSIAQAWDSLWSTPENGVKELIPEFFYMPEFLENANQFDLGIMTHTGEHVNDVILPPWAKSPEDFIIQNREALESDYVSEHLHEWIDLIFGYRQQGKPAEERLNKFYYLTYEGAVDLEAMENTQERESLEQFINNFGQTPTQLLKTAHPKRKPRKDVDMYIQKPIPMLSSIPLMQVKLINLGQLSADSIISINVPSPSTRPMSYYYTASITMLSSKGHLSQHSLQLKVGAQTGDSAGLKFYKGTQKPSSINVRQLTSSTLVTYSNGWIYSGGHWDNSVRGYSLQEQRTVFHRLWHSGPVTCLSCDAFGSKLITGSADRSCCIWSIESNGTIKANPLQTLFGHSEAISGCAISTELDMAVSASGDGVTNIYTVRKGVFIRTLQATNQSISAIPSVTLSRDGYILFPAISKDQSVSYLHLFSANGKTLAVDCVDAQIKFVCVDEDRIVTGDNLGNVEVRRLFSLEVIFSQNMGTSISSLSIVSGGSLVLVGLETGQVYLLAPVR